MFRVVLIAVISATAAGGGDDIESSWHVGVNAAFMIFDSCFGSFTSSNVCGDEAAVAGRSCLRSMDSGTLTEYRVHVDVSTTESHVHVDDDTFLCCPSLSCIWAA